MKLTVTVKEEDIRDLTREIFENMPEYSQHSVLVCVGWSYKNFEFVFHDTDKGNEYNLHFPAALRAVKRYLRERVTEGTHCVGELLDPCNYDADCLDIIVQYALLGEQVYG